jgi:hypothetical protein
MRGATLLAIIPDFVNLNVVTPINCQVGSASYDCHYIHTLTGQS